MCNILALFCKVTGAGEKSQFHKISGVALFLPHFLTKMKEILGLQAGIQYCLTCLWVNLNRKKKLLRFSRGRVKVTRKGTRDVLECVEKGLYFSDIKAASHCTS